MKQSKLLNYLDPRISYNSGQVYSLAIWRKKVLARDKDECKNCSNTIKFSKQFSNEGHHVIARRDGGKNTLRNGITLCKFCHKYFDYIYVVYGLDFYQLIKIKPKKERVKEVNRLMRKRYLRYLLRLVLS